MEKYMPPYQSDTPLDENLILFMSVPDFSSSSLAFWEYITENTSFRTVWVVWHEDIYNRLVSDGVKCAFAENREECIDWFSKAKYVVISDASRHVFPKPIGQIDVQLRCTMALYEDIFTLTPMNDVMLNFSYFAKARSTITDIFTASSQLTRTLTAAIHFIDARKVFTSGNPRHDPIIQSDGKSILCCAVPELKEYKKLALYCPSVKKGIGLDIGSGFENNIFNLPDFGQQEFENLLEVNNAAVVFKLHPADEFFFRRENPNVFSLPKYCFMIDSHTFWPKTLYHALNAFDVMITETSSLANEFLLLDRPIIHNHVEIDRLEAIFGSVLDDDELMFPGRVCKTSDEFFAAFQAAIDQPQEYHERRMKTQKLFHKYTDGKSCERLFALMQGFTPIENMDYAMFTQPLKEQIINLNLQKEKEISNLNLQKEHEICKLQSESEARISALSVQLAEVQKGFDTATEAYNNLNTSKTVRYARKIIKCLCPQNSFRRKFLLGTKRLLRG